MKKTSIIIIILLVISGGIWFVLRLHSPWASQISQTEKTEESGLPFLLPKEYKVTETDLENIDGGKRILVENGEPRKGFEITVLPFDESGLLTQERIVADIPDMEMNDVKNISVGENISALSFESTDENIGKTFEVWFVASGYLYEARTYLEFGEEMEEILKNHP